MSASGKALLGPLQVKHAHYDSAGCSGKQAGLTPSLPWDWPSGLPRWPAQGKAGIFVLGFHCCENDPPEKLDPSRFKEAEF